MIRGHKDSDYFSISCSSPLFSYHHSYPYKCKSLSIVHIPMPIRHRFTSISGKQYGEKKVVQIHDLGSSLPYDT